jgi:hypothetical protein
MNRPVAIFLTGLGCLTAVSAQAFTISDVSVTAPVGYTAPTIIDGAGNGVANGSNGWTFQFDATHSKVQGKPTNGKPETQEFTLSYLVTAAAGDELIDYDVKPQGGALEGSVALTVNTGSLSKSYSWTSPYNATTQTTLTDTGLVLLTPGQSFLVTADVTLTIPGNALSRLASATLTQYNVTYGEKPVPEPASMLGLTLGVLGVAGRKVRRSK